MKKYFWAITIIITFVNAYFIFFTENWSYGEHINIAAVIAMICLGIADISNNKNSKP